MATLLEIENLKTQFFTSAGTVRAVDGISYTVDEGETVALVGESGCGKSVSALSILRLIPWPPGKIVEGHIKFDGVDLATLSEEEIRHIRGKEISMVFQEPMTSLNPVLSINEQLSETLITHFTISQAEARKKSLELLELVGISDPDRRLDQYPHHLSGGMRQRVMIAMALSCEPKLIIADEPTTALDVTIQAQILDLMKELQREEGTAIIMITHDLGVIANICHRVLVMYAGKIVEQAKADSLFVNPRHPYTIGLLQSIPRWDEQESTLLKAIDGQPPHLVDLPPGCAFAPRCPFVLDKCREQVPPLVDRPDGGRYACFVNVDEITRQEADA